MKKLLLLILALTLVVAFTACGNTETINPQEPNDTEIDTPIKNEDTDAQDKEDSPENLPEVKPAGKPEVKPEAKPEVKPEELPEVKPEETLPEVNIEDFFEIDTEDKTKEDAPEVKPEDNQKATVGNILLNDFKSRVNKNSDIDVVSLADALMQNSVIPFGGGAMEIEEGFLSGFGNTEITGFKKGAMFAPMIGSIPFVGYVFELEDGADVSSFISTLKYSADLRWNICTEADEMVFDSVGNKVFFVMSPLSFDEE